MKTIVAIVTYCMMQYTITMDPVVVKQYPNGCQEVKQGVSYENVCDHQQSFTDSAFAVKTYNTLKKIPTISNVRLFYVEAIREQNNQKE